MVLILPRKWSRDPWPCCNTARDTRDNPQLCEEGVLTCRRTVYGGSMSRSERDILRELGRVTAALLHEQGYIAPVDVFLRFGSLTQADDERWRRGQIPVLVRGIQINLAGLTGLLRGAGAHS